MQLTGKSEKDYVEPPNSTLDDSKTNRPKLALIGGIIGAIAIGIYIITSVYPSRLFSQVQDQTPVQQQPIMLNAHPVVANSPLKISSITLFYKTDQVWGRLFKQVGKTYTKPGLQLFEDTVAAQGCGYALPVTGAFYCAEAKTIYLDLGFFAAAKKKNAFDADLVQAYVVGRQAGHHVQDLLGVTAKVLQARNRLSPAEYQKLTAKMEYQADLYAGIWLRSVYKTPLERSDMELAVTTVTQTSADSAPMRDRIQPETFTYTDISEHANWFYKGYTSVGFTPGDIFVDGELQ